MDNIEQTYRQLLADNIDLIRERCWYHSGTDKRLFVELLQEVYADLWYAMSLFDPTYSPQQQQKWVRERCRGVYKRHRRLIGPSLLPLVEDVPEDITPEVQRECIEELAEDLNDGERRLLDLLLQGYNQSECAGLLGISSPAVNKRYNRMIKKMKQRYAKTLCL